MEHAPQQEHHQAPHQPPHKAAIKSSAQQAPYVVFVTGTLASGKSSACAYLQQLGATYISADAISHELLGATCARDDALIAALCRHFGSDILAQDGSINRTQLATRAFSSTQAQTTLEQLQIPVIQAHIEKKLLAAGARIVPTTSPTPTRTHASFTRCIVVELPLLEKVPALRRYAHEILCIVAPTALRAARGRIRASSAFDAHVTAHQSAHQYAQQAAEFTRIHAATTCILNAASLPLLHKHLLMWYHSRIAV